uniref:Acireductone dioxygenase n=2 Tax=Lygus hesperus TaxID=30085 RepID=A0A0A9WLE1_LYGHE
MVKAWYMDDSSEDQRLEHHRSPPEFVDLAVLEKSTGVEYIKIEDIENLANNEQLSVLMKKRGYTYEDQITCSKECLPNYEEKIKSFFAEHLHTDEEIRLVLEGSGYFDVRDPADRWIRIQVTPGDLLIIPSGIYHRFTLDTKDFIRAKRFFVGEPVWTPYNRPADDMACRKSYVERLQLAS